MKRRQRLAALILGTALTAPLLMGLTPMKERKIVMFRPEISQAVRDNLVKSHGGDKISDLDLIDGQSIFLPPGQSKGLEGAPEVLAVEDDTIVQALGKPESAQPGEDIPPGITRIGSTTVWASGNTGKGVNVAVIDSGIAAHPDLRIAGGVSTVAYTRSYSDDHGHGTHVAGTIAALKNDIGVVGAAPDANLYAVKVLNRKGSGYTSDIIKGLDWCIKNNIQVINMSLGSTSANEAFKTAVQSAYADGIVIVAAAGNDGGAVNYPAAYPGVLAVGAVDSGDGIAYFSSRGSGLDLVAPGVSIISTYKGSAYTTMSGTSMASPHVAGAAALVLAGTELTNEGVINLLTNSTYVDDLGADGWDPTYGFGLVRADLALD